MFVSKADAHARLADPANLFRGSSTVVLTPSGEVPEDDVIDNPVHLEVAEGTGAIEDPVAREGVRQAAGLIHDLERAEAREDAHQNTPQPSLDEILAGLARPSQPYRMNRPVQAAIGETSLIAGNKTARGIAELGWDQTNRYENAEPASSKPGVKHPELKKHLDEARMRIARVTAGKLRKVMRAITDDKITGVESVAELSNIGKNLATILDKTTPKDVGINQGVHFHIYRPDQARAEEYETVTIGARQNSNPSNVIDV